MRVGKTHRFLKGKPPKYVQLHLRLFRNPCSRDNTQYPEFLAQSTKPWEKLPEMQAFLMRYPVYLWGPFDLQPLKWLPQNSLQPLRKLSPESLYYHQRKDGHLEKSAESSASRSNHRPWCVHSRPLGSSPGFATYYWGLGTNLLIPLEPASPCKLRVYSTFIQQTLSIYQC